MKTVAKTVAYVVLAVIVAVLLGFDAGRSRVASTPLTPQGPARPLGWIALCPVLLPDGTPDERFDTHVRHFVEEMRQADCAEVQSDAEIEFYREHFPKKP